MAVIKVALITTLFLTVPALSSPLSDVISRVYRQQPATSFSVTRWDLMNAIVRLENTVKGVAQKLLRHEHREAQMAAFSTKALNDLNADHTLSEKTMNNVVKELVKLEGRVGEIQTFFQKKDNNLIRMLSKLSEGINKILSQGPTLGGLPPLPPDFALPAPSVDNENIKNILKKLTKLDEAVDKGQTELKNEMTAVGKNLERHLEALGERQEKLLSAMSTCEDSHLNGLSEATTKLTSVGDFITKQVASAQEMIENGRGSRGCSEVGDALTDRLDTLSKMRKKEEEELKEVASKNQMLMEDQYSATKTLVTNVEEGKALVSNSLKGLAERLEKLDQVTKERLGKLSSDIKSYQKENVQTILGGVDSVHTGVKTGNQHILSALDDTSSQVENLQNSISENYEELSSEIKGLNKVEKVMINTADAVLDTKRSIEFGIQQVILELSDIVRNSGKNINSTLSDQINSISFAILKNQTSALTNMTSKMEQEISQVWRQIGIMYQQMSQSVVALSELQDTTRKHMNASLSRVGSMDGTVGQINVKVEDVESNLNYLLGRLSLVTSEFNAMKVGLGDELDKLGSLAKATRADFGGSSDPVLLEENSVEHKN